MKKRLLSILLVLILCASLTVNVFAETVTTVNRDSETVTDADQNTVITVTVKTETDGTRADGSTVDYENTRVEVTTVNPDGFQLGYSWTEDGSEIITRTEEDSGDKAGQPAVSVDLVPGQTSEGTASSTTVSGDLPSGEEDGIYDYTTTTVTDRKVTANTTSVETVINKTGGDVSGVQSALKFDRNNSEDQKQQKKDREIYTDNGHFDNPSKITVTGSPEQYPYQYVGSGDYSGHYVSHIRVIYERDDEGNPIVDENGSYVIKELQHSNGTTLTQGGVPTTDINGPFDQTTGTRPLQFLLMDEEGNSFYSYCIDLGTPAEEGKYYAVGNLEDNDYYASEETEGHIRSIVTNGYWGTASGIGSLDSVKEALMAKLGTEITVSYIDYGTDTKSAEKHLDNTVITETIVLTEEMINGLTEGEALDAMQSAIWSYANGANVALNGEDRMIVGDICYASTKNGDSLNKQTDVEGMARTKALYEYLVNLEPTIPEENNTANTIINDKNFVDDLTLTVGDKVRTTGENGEEVIVEGAYEAEISFTLKVMPSQKEGNDDLLVTLSYTDADGNPQTVVRRLAGENSEGRSAITIEPDENGVYTLTGLQLSENQTFDFELNLEGYQTLEQGAYVLTAEGGTGDSQTFVTLAEGQHTVDVSMMVSVSFDVEENNQYRTERSWHREGDPTRQPVRLPEETYEEIPPEDPPLEEDAPAEEPSLEELPDEEVPLGDLTEIMEEDVPLANVPMTGDNSLFFIGMTVLSAFGLAGLALTGSKKKSI